METSRGQNSNVRIACMPVDSRVLCAICGASAIGMSVNCRKIQTNNFVFRYLGRNFDAYTCLSCKGIELCYTKKINNLFNIF